MDQLIPVINDLQEVFQTTGIVDDLQLPEIVVVGSQSSGKSSVLESLVGKSILPRGTGIVTRCPIIIQMTPITSSPAAPDTPENGDDDWYCKLDCPDAADTKFTDCEEIRQILERRMDQLVNNVEKGITRTPIIIKIFSSKVIPLTVVDLPGIVKNAVGGQPKDIEYIVHELIKEKISNPNAIILAITPANTDIATSESIKLAAEVDKSKERTLAVITKLDLMDRGTNARKVLAGEIIPMKLGLIGVVNRSQEDIDQNKSIVKALVSEEEFLKKHYPHQQRTNGTQYLRKSLSALLMDKIRNSLPGLKNKINQLILENNTKNDALGKPIPTDDKVKQRLMDDNIHEFLKKFHSSVRGDLWDPRSPAMAAINLTDTKIQKRFGLEIFENSQMFSRNVRTGCNFGKQISNEAITKAILDFGNVEGMTSTENVIRRLAHVVIRSLEKTCSETADKIYEILGNVLDECSKGNGKAFRMLYCEMLQISRGVLKEQLQLTKKSIKEYLTIQSCMLYSMDKEFQGTLTLQATEKINRRKNIEKTNALANGINNSTSSSTLHVYTIQPPPYDTTKKTPVDEADASLTNVNLVEFPSNADGFHSSGRKSVSPVPVKEEKDKNIEYTSKMIKNYCYIIQRQIGDYIPKHIIHYLFDETLAIMRNRIRDETMGKAGKFICETPEVIQKRQELKDIFESLNTADSIIVKLEMMG